MNLLLSDGYYKETQELAILYQQYAKEYRIEEKKFEGHYKKFKKTEIYHQYNDFFKNHLGLNDHEKFYLDSRFHLKSYGKKYIDNLGNERTVIGLKENKIFTKKEFIDSVLKNKKEYIEREDMYDKEWVNNAMDDLLDLNRVAKEILKNHKRVGLIGYNTSNYVIEINGLSLDDFSLYDYFRVKDKHVYWFEK